MDENNSVINDVICHFRNMIQSGNIKPGDRFPSERVLAQTLGVSRTSVREALHYFQSIGLVSIRPGSGAYLEDDREALHKILDARQILERYSWHEMMQARRMIEVGIVQIAACTANREDKISLREHLKRVEATGKNTKTDANIEAHIMADYCFHREIARITHNALLVELHATIKGVILAGTEIWKNVPDSVEVGNPHHVRITEAIVNNDPIAATEAMEEHLEHMSYLYSVSRRSKAD